jgi:hypothetical protein
MTIKEHIKAMKYSRFFINRIAFVIIRQIYLPARIFMDASSRSGVFARVRFGHFYYQQATFTTSERYPLLFQTCADHLSSERSPKILSFGCSTGEEVFSIGKRLPKAIIMGVDINHWCLRQCRKKNLNPNYLFVHRFSKEFESASDFDAIFCLAVFQRTENRTNKDNSIASDFLFEQFEKEILVLDKKLKSGGLLMIDHADFRFEDTTVANKYIPLNSFKQNKVQRNRPLFDRENRKITEEHNCFRVFVKSSGDLCV